MATINILRTGSLVIGGGGGTPEPSGHADTRFTFRNGTTVNLNVSGQLNPWKFDMDEGENILDYDGDNKLFKYDLTSVDIGTGVTSIGEHAFSNCSGLTSVTILGSGTTSIGENAFTGCRGLTSVTIGSGVTSIGDSAFIDCENLTSVTIGSDITSIGSIAFLNCKALTSMTIDKTKAEVEAMSNKYWGLQRGSNTVTIHCTDDDITVTPE